MVSEVLGTSRGGPHGDFPAILLQDPPIRDDVSQLPVLGKICFSP